MLGFSAFLLESPIDSNTAVITVWSQERLGTLPSFLDSLRDWRKHKLRNERSACVLCVVQIPCGPTVSTVSCVLPTYEIGFLRTCDWEHALHGDKTSCRKQCNPNVRLPIYAAAHLEAADCIREYKQWLIFPSISQYHSKHHYIWHMWAYKCCISSLRGAWFVEQYI